MNLPAVVTATRREADFRMGSRRVAPIAMFLLLLASAAAPDEPPMVACVYSDYQAYMRKGAHDRIFAELGWPHHKWKNVNVSGLAGNLACYDLLLLHGVYNLANPTDFRSYRDQWLAFLDRGGVIVVAGIQDHPTQWDWIVDLGEEFRFDLTTFSGFQKPDDWTNTEAGLVFGPVKATWAEFETWSSAWTVTNRNANGKPIVLYQKVGKGIIVVSTSYLGAFSRAQDLLNIWTLSKKGDERHLLAIEGLSWGKKALRENEVGLTVRNTSSDPLAFVAALTVFNNGKETLSPTQDVRVEGHGHAKLSMRYVLGDGDNEISLVLRSATGDRVYARTGTRCELLDTGGALADVDRQFDVVSEVMADLEGWPEEILAGASERRAELAARARAVRDGLLGDAADVEGLYQRAAGTAGEARGLAAKVTTWRTLGMVPRKDQRFLVFAADSLRKIYRDRPLAADTAGIPLVELAGNEYESIQVVIVPLQGALQDVRVECTELTSGKGRIDDIQVRPVADCFLPIEGALGGWHPDVLLKNGLFEVPEDRVARAVWITVHTLPDTPAGTYSGKVSISARDARPVELTISAKVWDFAVPKKRNLATEFNLRAYRLARFYFGEKAGVEGEFRNYFTATMYRRFLEYLLRYRIAPYPYLDGTGQSWSRIAYLGEKRDGAKVAELDFTEFDETTRLMLDYGVEHIYAGCMRCTLNASTERERRREEYWRSFLPRMYAHLKEKGWDDKAFIYGWDEPPSGALGHVRAQHALIKRVMPTVKHLVPYNHPEQTPEADDPGYADILVPQWGLYSQQLAAERAKYGQVTWVYVVPGFEILRPTREYRGLFWDVWRRRCPGFLYFCTAFWHWSPSPADFDPDGSPRKTFLPKKSGETGMYHLCYPAGAKPEDGLNASIRLEAIRDGLEDWEYLNMLNGLIERSSHPESPAVKEAVALMREVDTGASAELPVTRRRVAQAIEAITAGQ